VLFALTASSGVIGCFVGTLFTVPLAHLFVASAYVKLMGLSSGEGDSRSRRHDEDDRPRPTRRPPPAGEDY
jgi:hypothetical protein